MVSGMARYQSWRAYVESVGGCFAITLHSKITAFLVNVGVHRKVLDLLSSSGPAGVAGVELGAADQVSVTPILDLSSARIVWEGHGSHHSSADLCLPEKPFSISAQTPGRTQYHGFAMGELNAVPGGGGGGYRILFDRRPWFSFSGIKIKNGLLLEGFVYIGRLEKNWGCIRIVVAYIAV
jgi:hypothetical protein